MLSKWMALDRNGFKTVLVASVWIKLSRNFEVTTYGKAHMYIVRLSGQRFNNVVPAFCVCVGEECSSSTWHSRWTRGSTSRSGTTTWWPPTTSSAPRRSTSRTGFSRSTERGAACSRNTRCQSHFIVLTYGLCISVSPTLRILRPLFLSEWVNEWVRRV